MNVLACAFCLSSDRNLFFMEERRFHLIYSMLDVDYGQYMKYLQSAGGLRACWCCQARVRSIQRFASSARRSLNALREHLAAATQVPLPSQTTLCITEVEVLDIPPLPLKPEPQSSHLAAKDEPQMDGLVCELVQLPTQGIKSEDDSVDNEDNDNYSDVDYLPEPEDIKTEPEVVTVKTKNLRSSSKVSKGTAKKKSVKKKKTKTSSPTPGWTARWLSSEAAARRYSTELALDAPDANDANDANDASDRACALCRRVFESEHEVAQHYGEVHDESAGKYQCNICHYRFPSLPRLQRHIEKHFVVYSCAGCEYSSRNIRRMRQHYEETHERKAKRRTKPTSYLCKRCKDTFATFALLREHRVTCTTYKCAKCGKQFNNKCTYFDHLPLHKEDAKVKLYCHVCDKQFTSPSWFKTHFRTSLKHVSRDTFQHECPHCKLRFHIAQRLKEHVAAKHMHRGLYACDLCNKSFTVNKSLKKHRARVHNIGSVGAPKRDKVCDHCGKAFTSTTFLNDHMRMHTGEKPFKCTLCPAAFAQNGTLYIHTLGVHKKKLRKDGLADSPSYQCSECGKQFSSSSQMRTHHKLVHLKQSNFACEACNKVFSSSTHLKNHLAGRHGVLSSDTFKCDTCGKRYNTNTALKTHMKRHGGLAGALHKCRACDMQFKHLTALHIHFKVVHLKLKKTDKVSLKNIGNPDKELYINGEPQRLP